MKKFIPAWRVTTTTENGDTFSEVFDTLSGAKIYAAAVRAGAPNWKTIIKRV